MAKKEMGAKAPKTSLLDLFESRGHKVSLTKTTLWEESETLVENHKEFSFYISPLYEGSSFAVVSDGTKSKAIPFFKGEIDTDDYVTVNDKGLVAAEDVDFTIDIKEMVALRDDEELGITKGDKCLRAFVS